LLFLLTFDCHITRQSTLFFTTARQRRTTAAVQLYWHRKESS
jgi:hypothetical protein